ncbi:Ig-like domain-containing protein [Pseudomonas sp. FR229a]|uniref:Ig-like domain-containing protein n=1 Tax=Pseudomonas sp. FR229a TaxID=3040313 RepID=UPI0025571E46|nr:Ig-like domain-containing protein [Pseudomonas sp. FR229a]
MPSHKNFRFPPLTEGTNTLALRPLLIPGMVEPVQDGDGGISIQVATDDPDGVLCVINPYLGLMSERDRLDIWWNNEKVLERFVKADEVNQRVFFYLPTPEESGWVENCHYVLTRVGETEPDPPSASLRVLIKLYKPGNFDREPHKEDGHSELNIVQLPPELVEQGVIDAEWAKNGVLATVPHYVCCTRNDKVRLQLGEYRLPAHRITPEQAEGLQPIEILIDQDAILGAGDGLKREIRYDINDEVWNWADRHSKRTYIDVDAGGWRLDPPIIKEAVNGVITIRDLNKQPVTIQIFVSSQYFGLGDSVKMTFIGTPPNNGEPIICSETRDIDNIPSVLDINVPYELIRAIAQGRADASYILYKKNGDDPLSSKRAFARVEGDVNMLPEPNIRELIGDTLEPDEPYATVDVRYAMKNGDLICLRWSGIKSDGDTYLHEVSHIVSENEAKDGLVTFYIDAEHINVLENGTLDLFYVVANDAPGLLDIRESERLLARIEKVRATLPAPEVEEADPPGDVLDPSKVFDKVHVYISEAKTLRGDILAYYWRSPNPFASTSDWLPITTVTEGQPVRFQVDAEFVTPNIGQHVKVRYSVLRASNKQYEHSATLNLLIGELVGELPPPEVVQAPDKTLNPMDGLSGVDINASYSSMNPDRDMIRLKWLGTPGAGTSDDLELPGSPAGTVQFHLPPSVIGANIARTVSVEYEVTRYTLTTPSQMLDLYVSDFQDPENELPHPQVPQAQNKVLDLMTFSGDAKAVLAIWPYIALKQRLWFYLTGQTSSGASHTIPLITGQEITSTQVSSGLNETLPRSELMKLGHSTPATVICKVAFDGSEKEDTACIFPQLPLTIRTRYDYVQPVITGVTDSRGEVEEGGKTRDEKVTVTGTATRGETVELFDGTTTSMGTAPVDADSTWSREIGPLTEKSYRISAKALYDADPVSSEPRTFNVKFAQTPEILVVSDSRGDVAHGATTYDNSVLVAGSATPNLQIKLLENKQPLITLDVDDKGDWNHRLNDLQVRSYSLTAEALYEIDPATSPPRDFVVAQAVTPTISRVSDLRGEVAANGTTYYRTVTLTGKASPNEKIILLNAGAAVETVSVNTSGDWQYVFSSLNLSTYRLTARGDYGSNPESSPPRVFTVAAFISPTITTVTDSVGTVGPNETTYDTAVTVKGEATPREQIQMYDNGAPVGTPVTVNADKQWTTSVTGLAIRSHSLTALAMYDVVPVESPARAFNVAAHIAPTLTSVHDGVSEVGNGGTTKNTSVTLRGKVTPNHEVQVYDNNNPKHTVRAVGDAWSTTLAVGLGAHSVKVKAVSTGQDSNSRSFNVISPIPPLYFNTNPVTLSGRIYLIPGSSVLPAFGPGTSVQHQASGGQPSYAYSTSNGNVAAVDSQSGLVTARGNGNATISVRDQAGQGKSYSVSVTGVTQCYGLSANWLSRVGDEARSRGLRLPSMGELRAISSAFGNRWPLGNSFYWSNESILYWPNPNPYYHCRNLVTGEEKTIMNLNVVPGVGITP